MACHAMLVAQRCGECRRCATTQRCRWRRHIRLLLQYVNQCMLRSDGLKASVSHHPPVHPNPMLPSCSIVRGVLVAPIHRHRATHPCTGIRGCRGELLYVFWCSQAVTLPTRARQHERCAVLGQNPGRVVTLLCFVRNQTIKGREGAIMVADHIVAVLLKLFAIPSVHCTIILNHEVLAAAVRHHGQRVHVTALVTFLGQTNQKSARRLAFEHRLRGMSRYFSVEPVSEDNPWFICQGGEDG